MKHIWRNLRGLWKNERLLLAIMILCVFSSALLLQFAYGLYQNYHVLRVEAEDELKYVTASVAEGETLTAGELRQYVEALPKEIAEKADQFQCEASIGKLSDHVTMTPELQEKFDAMFKDYRIWYDKDGNAISCGGQIHYDDPEVIKLLTEDGVYDEQEQETMYEQQLRDEYGDGLHWEHFTPDTDLSVLGLSGGYGFKYRNGEYGFTDVWRNTMKKEPYFVKGDIFTDAQVAAGENVCYLSQSMLKKEAMIPNIDYLLVTRFLQTDENHLTLYHSQTAIVGVTKSKGFFGNIPTVPFTVLPDDWKLGSFVGILFPRNIDRRTYDTLTATADEVLPGKLLFADMNFPDKDNIYLYNNIMLISALIAVLSVLNFVMLYHFILKRRSRSLAVYRMAGCTAGKAVRIYLGECFVIGIPVYLLGLAAYLPLMHRLLSKIFPYMEESYNLGVYAAIFGMYLLMMLVMLTVMVSRHVRQSIWKEWGNGI